MVSECNRELEKNLPTVWKVLLRFRLTMLSYRTEGPIAYATLDRPEKLNAMTR